MSEKRSAILPQLTKYCNETLILSALCEEKKHGYDLALHIESKSESYFSFHHGTLYPILHKLEKEGLIRGSWKREGPKRRRKYYSLTPRGRKDLNARAAEWQTFCAKITMMTKEAS